MNQMAALHAGLILQTILAKPAKLKLMRRSSKFRAKWLLNETHGRAGYPSPLNQSSPISSCGNVR